MAKPNDNTKQKEALTFEEIKGNENLFKAKVVRNGQVHEISVYAIQEEEFEKANQEYAEKINELAESAY